MCRCVVLEGKLLYAVFLGLCKRYVFIRVLCTDDKLNYLREYSPVSVRCETSIIVLCTNGIKDFVYQRVEGELINRIFNATSA